MGRDEPLGLEDALEVTGDDWWRCREEAFGHHHVHTASTQVPSLDEIGQRLAVQTDTPAVEPDILRIDRPGVPVDIREDNVESGTAQVSSASLTVIASMVSDRFVSSYWPTKPSDCSQPASAASATCFISISDSP